MASRNATLISWTGVPAWRRRLGRGGAVALPIGLGLALALVAAVPAQAAEQSRFVAVPALFAVAAVETEALEAERALGFGEAVDTSPLQSRDLAVILWDETNGKHGSATIGGTVSLASQIDSASIQTSQ